MNDIEQLEQYWLSIASKITIGDIVTFNNRSELMVGEVTKFNNWCTIMVDVNGKLYSLNVGNIIKDFNELEI